MTYFEGFIAPVPEKKKDAYREHAASAAPLLREIGVVRHVENWDSDIPEGKLTDFRKAVDAKPDEKIVFAWFEYPSREARDATNQKMMSDPRMEQFGADMPFDGKRMVVGGFAAIVEEGGGHGGYTDGMIVPVPEARRDAYREMATKNAKIFRGLGATRVIETLADDVPHGKVTDFYRAVKSEPGESIAFSFIEWPDKATRDEAWKKMMDDESMRPQGEVPFAGKRMFWGGFDKILDTAEKPPIQASAPITA